MKLVSSRAVLIAGVSLLLVFTGNARADYLGSLRFPQSTPPVSPLKQDYDLTAPPPVNSSWAQAGHRPLGVYLPSYTLTAAQIDAVGQTGCGLVRLAVPFEPFAASLDSSGRVIADDTNWLALDQVVSRLRRAGLEVLPVLTAVAPPAPPLFQRFCSAFAQRYGPTFRYYQILDNVNYFVGLPSQEYADLLAGAKLALVSADSDAQIVCGGIRGCDLTYLEMLEANGGVRTIDILALDLYPPNGGIEQVAPAGMRAHSLPFVADVMAWARQRGKPLWVTSLGVPTSFNDAFSVGVDQVTQASDYARAALILGYLGVERIIYASIQDTDPSYTNPVQCCGLLDVTGAPKASYYALKALAQVVDGAYQVAPRFACDSSAYARYSESDLFNAAKDQDVPESNPNAAFEVHDLPIYAFWLYNPTRREYRLVYWLAYDPPLQHLISLTVYDTGVTATEEYQLLDNAPSPLQEMRAQNLLSLQFLPLSLMPTVLRFEVRQHGSGG